MKWKRENKAAAPAAAAPPPAIPPPAEAPAAAAAPAGDAPVMPEGMTKMEEMKWKRENKAAIGVPTAAAAPPPTIPPPAAAAAAAADIGEPPLKEDGTAMTKMEQMKVRYATIDYTYTWTDLYACLVCLQLPPGAGVASALQLLMDMLSM